LDKKFQALNDKKLDLGLG